MYKSQSLALLCVLFLGLAGCSATRPSLAHPGSAQVQQNRAVRFDPYPENETGPAMVGVRPREFDKPITEPARARWQMGN